MPTSYTLSGWPARLAAVAAASVTAVALAACGSSKPGGTTTAAASTSAGSSSSQTSSAPPQGVAVSKIAGIGLGSITNSTWDNGNYKAFQALAKQLGAKGSWLQLVGYDQAAQTLTRLARAGYPIIVASSNGYEPAIVQVAKQFPHTWFWVYSATPTKGIPGLPNVAGMLQSAAQSGYLKASAACLSSQSGKVGEVFGEALPQLTAEAAAAKVAAAKYCKGGASAYHAIFTGTFTDPSKGKQAALALVGRGADTLFDTADATGGGSLALAASNPKLRYIGYVTDQSGQAPKTIVMNVLLGFDKAYANLGRLYMSKQLKPIVYDENLQNGGLGYTLPFKNIPDAAAAQEKFMQIVDQIKSGQLTIK